MAIDCINIGDGFNNIVLSSLIQPDGKIVTGGLYTQYDGVSENYAVRLNSNGFKDTSFNIGSGFNDWVRTVHYQPDTKIVIGGEFTAFTGTAEGRLIRLNSDGSKDTSFNIETGFNSTSGFGVLRVAQYGTSLYVGGGFTTFTGQTNNKLIRLNSDGSKDTSFDIGTGFNTGSSVNSIYVQSDNKVLVGGDFITFTGSTQRGLIRLNTDGSKDTSFDIGTGFSMSTIVSRNINSIAQQTDNKLLIGGFFTQYSGIPQGYLIRLNLNGTKDTSFDIGIGFNSSVRSVVIQPDGKILVGGDFSTFNTVPENGLIRLNTGGTKDNSFYLGAGFNNGADIYSINLQVDGSLIVTGNFTSYDGVPANRIVKLSSDGELLNCLPIEPTPTPTETPTQTPTNTQTPSVTPTNTNTPSVTPTNTQTPTNTPTNTQTPSPTPTKTTTPTQTPTNTKTPTQTPSGTPIVCGLGITKGQYYYLDCCKNFVSGNQYGLEVSFDYTQPFGGIVKLNTRTTAICPSPTPTPTKTVTPTNTATPTNTPTKTVTPTVSKTPPVTPSNTPVTRLKNACDVITLFEMGISCNVIQSPTESNPLSGILSINVTGGTAPYSFFWEGGQRSQTLFGVPAGSYEVVVTDYNWPDGSPDYTATTICELFGPTPSPTQTMTPTPSNTPPIQCVDLCLIAIGTVIWVRNIGGASNIGDVPNIGPIQFVCDGTQNGRFRWTSGRYDIVWNINNNRWEIYIAGTTTLYVLDGGGILASTTFNLIPDSAWAVLGGSDTYSSVTMTRGNCPRVVPLQVSIQQTNSSCQGTTNCNGSISIIAQDGLPPYSYSIDGGITYSTNNNFTNLCSNDYTVVVNDSGNNSRTSTVTIDYDSAPVTYQLSLANVSPATTTSVPNVSKTVTQQVTLVSTPPLPVGVSVTFNLLSTALTTVDGPGSASSSVIWNVTKNGSSVNTTVGPTTQTQETRPFCSPNIRTITSTDYSSSITVTNGDVINITSTTVDTITNGQVASQSNCTTNILTQVSSVISTPTILGNNCSSVIGSSRQIQSNEFTYVPVTTPPNLLCFGYLYNFYAVTGSTSQSITSSDVWSVPSSDDWNTLSASVGGNGNSLKLVDVTTYWNSSNTNATNESGFGGIGNGNRNIIDNFQQQKIQGAYISRTPYSLTESINMVLQSNSNSIIIDGAPNKHNGIAVRLVKNSTTLSPGQTGIYTGNDGKTYPTICIGTQEWMSKDLRETKYRGLSSIPNVTDQTSWNALTTGAYCIYNNNLNFVAGCPTPPSITNYQTAIIINDPDDSGEAYFPPSYNFTSNTQAGPWYYQSAELTVQQPSLFQTFTLTPTSASAPQDNDTFFMTQDVYTNVANYIVFNPTSNGNKMWYLISPIQYTSAQLTTILANATQIQNMQFITSTTPGIPNRWQGTFVYDLNPTQTNYVYLIWDYRKFNN